MSNLDTSMRVIPIRNPELIEILDRYVRLRTDNPEAFEEYMHLSCKHQMGQKDWFTGEKYLSEIIAMGQNHEGFPEQMVGYEFRTNQKNHRFFKNEFPVTGEEAKWRQNFVEELSAVQLEIMHFMGCRNNALTAVYPPGGFIGWHNNANASAWNFIFSWSENGEGSFDYWDIEKGEIVKMQDEPGWQLKAGYFGHYGEEDKVFYHSAGTDCWRHTISFCFDRSDASEEYREEIIDEISSE